MVMVDVIADRAAKQLAQDMEQRSFYFQLTGRPSFHMNRYFDAASTNPLHPEGKREKDDDYERILRRTVETQLKYIQERAERIERELQLADTDSYEALMEAQERQALLANFLRTILENAHELPDGRRVFLSRDGTYAIDEHGEQLTEEEIASVEWDVGRPTAEEYAEKREALAEVEADIDELQDYRGRLDDAQTRLDNGDPLSADELDDLDALLDDMPDVMRQEGAANRNGTDRAGEANVTQDPASRANLDASIR